MGKPERGFTLIELMISITIVGILASLVIPAYQNYAIRSQVSEGLVIADGVKTAVEHAFLNRGAAPTNRAVAGLSANASDSQGKYVAGVDVDNGVIIVTFGNESNIAIQNMTLTLTPYETPDFGIVWRCGYAPAPSGLDAMGTAGGATIAAYTVPTVPEQYVSQICRS